MPKNKRLWFAMALLGWQIQAQANNLLTPYVDVSYDYNSNVYSRPDDVPDVDGVPRGDNSLRTQVGLALEKEIGRQKLTARAGWMHTKFQQLSQLDFDNRDVQGNFKWALGNHLTGNVGFSRTTSLSTGNSEIVFDPNNPGQSMIDRNLRVQRNRFVDAAWHFHPSWRVRGTISQYELSNELDLRRFNNRTRKTSEMWLDYLSSSRSSISLLARYTNETFPYGQILNNRLVDNDKKSEELKIKIDWVFSGKTQVQMLLGMARLRHETFTERDYNGMNGRITANWYPTGKIELGTAIWHEVASVDNLYTNYSVNNGIRLAPVWNISPKMRLEASWKYEKRVPVGVSGVTIDFSEKVSTRSMTLTYVPLARLQLAATMSYEALSSELKYRPYHTRSMSLNAHYEY